MTRLLSEPRRKRILEWIEEEGSARVRDLASALVISEATTRQDLERLEKEGHITREHGALDLVQAFITDDGISDADAKAFEARGIEVPIAGKDA